MLIKRIKSIPGPPMEIITIAGYDMRKSTLALSEIEVIHHVPNFEIYWLDINVKENAVYWTNGIIKLNYSPTLFNIYHFYFAPNYNTIVTIYTLLSPIYSYTWNNNKNKHQNERKENGRCRKTRSYGSRLDNG